MLGIIRHKVSRILGLEISEVSNSASFIELGGNSLSALALKNACILSGVIINFDSVLTASSLSELSKSSRWAEISKEHHPHKSKNDLPNDVPKEALFDVEQSSKYPVCPNLSLEVSKSVLGAAVRRCSNPSIPERAAIPPMLLSFIYGGQRQPGSNIIHYYETYSFCHLHTLKKAWKKVIESEPIFRTTFHLHDGKGTLTERHVAPFNWTEVITSSKEIFEKEVGVMHRTSEVETSFKVVILPAQRRRDSKFTIIWRVHHALVDGYSHAMILKKLRRAMEGLPLQIGVSFVPLAKKLEAFRITHQLNGEQFWRQQTRKYGAGRGFLALPEAIVKSEGPVNHSTDIKMLISRHKHLGISKRTGATPASLYYAAWALVLSSYTGSDTVTCGAIFSCRNLPLKGISKTIGSMINTLPFTITLDRNQTLIEYIRYVFLHLVKLSNFQWTIPEDGYTRNFSTILGVQLDEPLQLNQKEISTLEKPFSRVLTDIPLNIRVDGDGSITFSFCEAHCSRKNVETMIEMFHRALSSFSRPQQTLDTCLQGLLTVDHRKQLLTMGNSFSPLTMSSSVSDDLVTLFERCATKFPTAIAIEKGLESVTYAQLNDSTTSVASYLASVIEAGDVVCVHADRSINWIIAIYGILKARGIYCPLDSVLPPSLRTSYIDDAGSRVFLTATKDQHGLIVGNTARTVSVEEILLSTRDTRSRKCVIREAQGLRDKAYLCFTSGSSGKPKGVVCTHKGLVAFQSDLEVRLFAQPGRKISQIMSPAFDGSIHEIFSALSYGATLVLGSMPTSFGHLGLVDSAILTPSLAAMLNPLEFPRLRTIKIYLVGEAVPRKVQDCWAADKQLYNMYGPTEATCGATIKRMQPNEAVTIGVANPSTRIYILDERQQLLPHGVIGEIYLAGVQISLGYIGNPEETAARFMADTIRGDGERMYRTGDRGVWNNDGEIIYVGRTDRQIKLRGFRLDLNDLEARILNAVPSAKAVSVTTNGDQLVAMFQPASLNISTIRSLITKVMPPYAIPQRIATVDNIPMTPVGKVDYRVVAEYEYLSTVAKAEQEQQRLSDSQDRIAAAWRNVLNLPTEARIHQNSNILDLGGTSINLLLLSHRLSAEFKRSVPLKLILETNNLSELSQAIEEAEIIPEENAKARHEEVTPQSLKSHLLSPIEYDWWAKYQLSEETSCFNVSFACSLGDSIDLWKLTTAWNAVLSRHSILRCRYILAKDRSVRKEYALPPPLLQRVREIDLGQEINRPFHLHQHNPIRVLMSRFKMLVVASHIICDLTTMRTLLSEVSSIYVDETFKPAKRKRYPETKSWAQVPSRAIMDFWTAYLQDTPCLARYDLGNLTQPKLSYRGSSRVCKVPLRIFEAMTRFAARSKLSLHQLALAAVSLALTYSSNEQDIILGAPYLNRASEDMEIIGLFLQPLPIRICYSEKTTITSSSPYSGSHDDPAIDPFLLAVRKSSQAALSHEIQWHQLLKHLKIPPNHPTHLLFDVMVTFHEFDPKPMLPILDTRPLYTWTKGSKFKLMVEANAVSRETLILRLEYDEGCFSCKDVEMFQQLLLLALEALSEGVGYADVKERLRCFVSSGSQLAEVEQRLFFDT